MARWLTLVLGTCLCWYGASTGQAQDRLPPPTPVPPVLIPAPPPSPAPPPPPYVAETLPVEEPRPQGWFTGFDAGIAFLTMRNFPDFATVNPNTTVAWAWQLGYRFESGSALRFSAAGLNSSGNGNGWDAVLGPVQVRSSVDNFYCDLDYVSRRLGSPDAWSIQWHGGARFSGMELKTRLYDGSLEARAINDFGGAGFHLGLEAQRALGSNGWSLFGKFDGGVVWGEGKQTIDATLGGLTAGVDNSGPESVPMVQLQAGLRWEPPAAPWLRFTAGYAYEQWWVNADGENSENAFFDKLGFTGHGPFLRCEFGY